MKADKKNRIHVVYSTDPNYNYEYNNETEDETLPPEKQNLRVILDSKQRKGKTVTLVQGFVGREDDLKELAKLLKNKCGVGGSVKDGEIIIQGEVKEKVLKILRENKSRAKYRLLHYGPAILSIQFSSERRYYLLSEEFVKSLQPSPFCFSP